APIADMGTVYAAFDEEGGNAFGGSFMVANVTIGLDSKLEALEEELGEDRSNTISLAYAVDGLSLGAEWNSVEDGNQWAVNAAYEANGMAVAFDTNEAEEWTATASYDLSDAASVDLGVNYTEDAFVGLSLAF
ncbi:hypothetical protein MWN63_15735, partial [Paradonghicola geojensis]|nr:hypothetical protein [Marivivens geojensis]